MFSSDRTGTWPSNSNPCFQVSTPSPSCSTVLPYRTHPFESRLNRICALRNPMAKSKSVSDRARPLQMNTDMRSYVFHLEAFEPLRKSAVEQERARSLSAETILDPIHSRLSKSNENITQSTSQKHPSAMDSPQPLRNERVTKSEDRNLSSTPLNSVQVQRFQLLKEKFEHQQPIDSVFGRSHRAASNKFPQPHLEPSTCLFRSSTISIQGSPSTCLSDGQYGHPLAQYAIIDKIILIAILSLASSRCFARCLRSRDLQWSRNTDSSSSPERRHVRSEISSNCRRRLLDRAQGFSRTTHSR